MHLPTPHQLRETIPLTDHHASFIQQSRQTIQNILRGVDHRKLLIVGPCSIHNVDETLEYATLFQALAKEVSEQFFMVMRTYCEKARTITGWKGLTYDPDLDGSHQLGKGLHLTRRLLADLTEMQIPTASELLEITTTHYYADYLSWGCIGSRTSSSPPHRQLAASLPLPMGFKNTTDGSIDHAVHGILAARSAHVFLGLDMHGKLERVQAEGNPLCHLVLRGGTSGPNYTAEHIAAAAKQCREKGILDKLLVDCSHDNSQKRHLNQIAVFQSVIEQIVEGNQQIAGLMLESHLLGGNQLISDNLRRGVSITDPCLDWKTTRRLIVQAAIQLDKICPQVV